MVHMVHYRLHTTHRGNIDKEHTNTHTEHMHKHRKIKHGMNRNVKGWQGSSSKLGHKSSITLKAVHLIHMELQSWAGNLSFELPLGWLGQPKEATLPETYSGSSSICRDSDYIIITGPRHQRRPWTVLYFSFRCQWSQSNDTKNRDTCTLCVSRNMGKYTVIQAKRSVCGWWSPP